MVLRKFFWQLRLMEQWYTNQNTVTVQRTGGITVKGKSTSTLTNPANDVILQKVQLEKSGNCFIFGSKPIIK